MQHIKHIIIVAIFAIFCAPTAWANVGYDLQETRESHQRDDERHLACSDSSAPRICRLVMEEMRWARKDAQKSARETQNILFVIAVLLGICVFALYCIYRALLDIESHVRHEIEWAAEKISRSVGLAGGELPGIAEDTRKIYDHIRYG